MGQVNEKPAYLLDSVIVIDHLNGVPHASELLRQLLPVLAVSAITRAEVMAGLSPADEEPVKRLFDRLSNFSIDAETAELAGRLRRTEGWKLPDALQAALAQHHHVRLITRNTKDFDPEKYSFVWVPYR